MEHLSSSNSIFVFPERVPFLCAHGDLSPGLRGGERTFHDFCDLPNQLKWTIDEYGKKQPQTYDISIDQLTQR
jgi:hypothetical protein